MAILSFYLKLFLLFSILFGITVYFIFYFMGSFSAEESRVTGVIAGASFGLFMTWALGKRQIDSDGSIMPCRVTDELTVHKGMETTIAQAKDVLSILGFKIIKVENDKILASSGMSRFSWGENISLVFEQKNSAETMVRISSKPKLIFTLIDSGANLLNVERIKQELKNI